MNLQSHKPNPTPLLQPQPQPLKCPNPNHIPHLIFGPQLGKEGFDVFAQSPVLVDGEDLQTLPMMVRQKLTEHGPTHTILDFEQGEGRIQFH